jgi:hypothetical protein
VQQNKEDTDNAWRHWLLKLYRDIQDMVDQGILRAFGKTLSGGKVSAGGITGVIPPVNWSPMTTKGDLIAEDGTPTAVRLPVGSNGQVLTADSTQTAGVAWETAPGFANPMTTQGDMIYENATPAPARLPIGVSPKEFMVSTGTLPYWAEILTDSNGNVLTDGNGNVLWA